MTDEKKSPDSGWAAPAPVEHGGRVELRLATEEDGSVRYLARWYTSEEKLDGAVSVGTEDKTVEVESPESLPAWLESFTTSLVRTTARQAEASGTWPRRLTRWRKAPNESGD